MESSPCDQANQRVRACKRTQNSRHHGIMTPTCGRNRPTPHIHANTGVHIGWLACQQNPSRSCPRTSAGRRWQSQRDQQPLVQGVGDAVVSRFHQQLLSGNLTPMTSTSLLRPSIFSGCHKKMVISSPPVAFHAVSLYFCRMCRRKVVAAVFGQLPIVSLPLYGRENGFDDSLACVSFARAMGGLRLLLSSLPHCLSINACSLLPSPTSNWC
jgi:hypothetical protein